MQRLRSSGTYFYPRFVHPHAFQKLQCSSEDAAPQCSAIATDVHKGGSDKQVLTVTPGRDGGTCYPVLLPPHLSAQHQAALASLFFHSQDQKCCWALSHAPWFLEFVTSTSFSGLFAVGSGHHSSRQLAFLVGSTALGCLWLLEEVGVTARALWRLNLKSINENTLFTHYCTARPCSLTYGSLPPPCPHFWRAGTLIWGRM